MNSLQFPDKSGVFFTASPKKKKFIEQNTPKSGQTKHQKTKTWQIDSAWTGKISSLSSLRTQHQMAHSFE